MVHPALRFELKDADAAVPAFGCRLIHVNDARKCVRYHWQAQQDLAFTARLPGLPETFGVARQQAFAVDYGHGDNTMSLGTILLIILVIALLGGFSGIGGGRFYGTGYYGGGGLGIVIVILLVLLLLGKL